MMDSVNEEQIQLGEMNDEDETEPTTISNQSIGYFTIGKTFNNLDDAYEFYNEYGLSRGFGIRKHHITKHKDTNEIYRRMFVCNKQGFKDMNDKRRLRDDVKRRCITRTGCKAMIQVSLSKQGEWMVDRFDDEHNHPLDPPSQVLRQRSHNVLHRSKECRDVITLLSKTSTNPSEITKIVNAFRGKQDDKRIQCSNSITNERKTNLGKEYHQIITHFHEKAEMDKDFYFAMDLSTDGTLKNVFWADGRSRSSYNQFGDVVIFDVTYKTNKLSLPFVSFVGVNHHGQSILFGAALLENESETTFAWLFKHFLKCMYECPPISIITDQDLAMGKAIAKVFPKTRHRYCAWHIQKHVSDHLQPLQSQYDDFQSTYIRWVKSQNIEDSESRWEELKTKYHIEDNTWLENMYKLRHHWIKTYLKDTFFAGMTTSGRSKDIHSFFDGFVNSTTMLNDFVLQYDNAMSFRRRAEKHEDFRTINSKPILFTHHPIEAMVANCYTRNMYEAFKKEWKTSFDCGHETLSKDVDLIKYRVGHLKVDKENWKNVEYRVTSTFFANCSCGKFETFGIQCKHILYIMRKKQLTSIPDHYVLPRWTMRAKYNVGSTVTGWRGTNGNTVKGVTFLTLWSVRAKFNKALEDAKDSLSEIEKVDTFLDDFLEEQCKRKKITVELNSEINSSTSMASQEHTS